MVPFLMEAAPQSFTARRAAASHLPNFQLPPPPDALANVVSKHAGPSYSYPTAVSNLLTPPALPTGDFLVSPGASSVHSTSSTGSPSINIGPTYQPMDIWPSTSQRSGSDDYGASMPVSSAPFAPSHQGFISRSLCSPSSNDEYGHGQRSAVSPSNPDGLPPPPYDGNFPPFPTHVSMSGGPNNSHSMPNLAMSPLSQAPPQMQEQYGARPPPTPTYYTPSSTPQQSSFPSYVQPSPTQTTSQSHGGNVQPRESSLGYIPQSLPYPPRPFTYPLPALAGHAPIMSNLHAPGSQMSLVGSMNPYFPPQMGQGAYGQQTMQHTHQQTMNDRPFKCDQCQQSFNRNHDLKRHKRIHLAVKPFPCGHCDKSFSRKDALKVRLHSGSSLLAMGGRDLEHLLTGRTETHPRQELRQERQCSRYQGHCRDGRCHEPREHVALGRERD